MKLIGANKMLQPDLMYDQIVSTVNQFNLKLIIKRVPLNYIELQKILTQKIKVFFILCHGETKKNVKPQTSNFCLEKKDQPTVLDEFDEERLKELIRTKIQCETIVISACHSSRLAEILFTRADPNKNTIVAINSKENVLERAAQSFNEAFLHYLLKEETIEIAFENSLGTVAGSE